MIKAVDIHKSYGPLHVLKGVSLEVGQGEIVSIVGASGAGKTTLLQILGTLDTADRGEIWYDDVNVAMLKEKELARFRNEKIGFVFQAHHLLPEFTALENVCIPAMIKGQRLADAKNRAMELLQFMKVDHRAMNKPTQLSGGEQQRVAVARALMNSPAAVLADEPSGNLDSVHARELHELFFRLRDQFRQTFIIVTHNEELASMADKKIMIKDGQKTE